MRGGRAGDVELDGVGGDEGEEEEERECEVVEERHGERGSCLRRLVAICLGGVRLRDRGGEVEVVVNLEREQKVKSGRWSEANWYFGRVEY